MENYKGLTNEQIALICATEIVKAELNNEWDFTENSPSDIVMRFAYRFNNFLESPDSESET
jgi:hypothetical protein